MADNENKSQGEKTPEKAAGKSASAKAATPKARTDEPAGGRTGTTSARESASKARARKTGTSSSKFLWVVVIITFLLVLALAGAGYWYWQQQGTQRTDLATKQQQQIEQLGSVEQQNQQLRDQLLQLQQSKEQLAATVSQLADKTDAIARQSEQALAEISNMEGKRPADWLLAEADYLVRMAGRKVWLEKDIRTALMLLKNADTRLSELADPSILPIRELIAKDIQTLRQINPVSRTSVALAVSGMLSQVNNLPLDTFEKPAAKQSSELSESPADWQQNLKQVWRNIVDDFISVERTDTPVEPVMSKQEQWLNREQLKLQLMQAQSAAIAAQSELYEQSLQNALQLLINQYDIEDAAVKGFINSVQNLLETDVSQQLPEALQSADPLQRLLDKRVDSAFGRGDRAS